ncbi:cytochrome P450 [Halalkalicoccus tibetensis]|uniref:Cytochrome P450 n=1 Tax=Halalkalicoccus tibetensis TaxID=175632 RepID=A0ABD5V8K7_9EURY
MQQEIPHPPRAGIVNAVRFGTDPFRFLEGMQARFEEIVAVPIPGRAPLVIVTDPDLIHDALARPGAFSRVPAREPSALIAEQGLVQSEGALWRQQRSIMGPAFRGKQVTAYANTVGETVDGLVDEWHAADDPEARDLHEEMTSLTIRVASEILLGEDIGRENAEQFHDWMRIAGAELEFSPTSVRPSWLPQRTSPEFRRAAEGIRELSDRIIEQRRASLADAGDEREGPPRDMLALLLRAEDDPDVTYSENQIRDEVATFLIAGHETTALSLTYTLALLARHPSMRERVREEADAVLGDERPRYEHVGELEYAGHVYREALRLYPPAWAVFRQASRKVRLGDYRVEEGSAVILPQWSVHRDERYFDAPNRFDPGRWERRSPSSVGAYFPFSTGPHACIGSRFALSGAVLAVARLTQAFEIDVASAELRDLRPTPTLRPADGVSATVRAVDRS